MRDGHSKRVNLYEAAKGADLQRRLAMGAPLARGVQGREQALGNMTPNDRHIAQLKTKLRAENRPVPRRVG